MSKVKVRFGEPIHGWLPVEVDADSARVAFNASHVYPSLTYLVMGLTSLLSPTVDQTVNWTVEPTEYDFVFRQIGDGNISLTITEYPDSRRTQSIQGSILLTATGDYSAICLPFWRALRSLQARMPTDIYSENWTKPFPDSELNKLTQWLREMQLIT